MRARALTLGEVLDIGDQVADALDQISSQGFGVLMLACGDHLS